MFHPAELHPRRVTSWEEETTPTAKSVVPATVRPSCEHFRVDWQMHLFIFRLSTIVHRTRSLQFGTLDTLFTSGWNQICSKNPPTNWFYFIFIYFALCLSLFDKWDGEIVDEQ